MIGLSIGVSYCPVSSFLFTVVTHLTMNKASNFGFAATIVFSVLSTTLASAIVALAIEMVSERVRLA